MLTLRKKETQQDKLDRLNADTTAKSDINISLISLSELLKDDPKAVKMALTLFKQISDSNIKQGRFSICGVIFDVDNGKIVKIY